LVFNPAHPESGSPGLNPWWATGSPTCK